MKFKVADNETITDCLARMKKEGYMPVKRLEKPVFQEQKDGRIEVSHQEIIFVGKKIQ
ncbi:NETI motif-containing protein [Staphylococcus argenteus]|uniref:NETI motif-containing protein n=1 Tax=Staphylococcus argenteus TaxID=985002 RepID=UPI001FBA655E|nr:NETI motif-containing protein [Staphylococcus argenteus]MCG9795858.1 NETI motif-containing protein [Staphylococcus argenteus]GJF45122.1 NETI motif-containing protein [Staphylococcus argenteus]GJF55491.1 NETI motif-containing protein [Staphylococcus argenteus]GJF60470.1 NETI motif-containing protein [Staphylococcus argenteus]GJF73475.1 NETI motif-containing protein [Staphylococcus argenteus]